VAAHAFRRLGEVSAASQPSLPGWDAFSYSLTSFRAMPGVKMTYLSARRGDTSDMRRAEETNSCQHYRS
jgi:hypothetical protein